MDRAGPRSAIRTAGRTPDKAYQYGPSSVPFVRRGLVVVGLAIALIGGGMVASLFLLGGVQTTNLYDVSFVLPGNVTENATVKVTPDSSGSVSFSWSAKGSSSVSVWAAGTCPSGQGICATGPALYAWSTTTGGRWSKSGAIGTYYNVSTTNLAGKQIQFSGTFSEEYTTSDSGLTLTQLSLILAGAIVLLGIGGVAIFLGLFLRGGVYSDPAGNVARPRRPPTTEWDDSEADDDVELEET